MAKMMWIAVTIFFFVPERKIQFFKRFLSLFLALLQKMLISLFNFFFKNFFPLARHSSAFVPQNGLVKYYQIELQKKPPSWEDDIIWSSREAHFLLWVHFYFVLQRCQSKLALIVQNYSAFQLTYRMCHTNILDVALYPSVLFHQFLPCFIEKTKLFFGGAKVLS